ncbi:MAG TPA: hypothetical protein VKI64_10500, partial [Acidimicrobiales bacterium]|nr:hypothetical protein [Acidimicrobiales bacterium]
AWLSPMIAHPSAPPAAFSARSARPAGFTAWGWTFTPHRDVREFVYLTAVSSGGLGVTGSGSLSVVTAPLYRPRTLYWITAAGPPQPVTADDQGRLAFLLDLGPSHESQQSDFSATATQGWTHLQVSIRR